MVIRLCSLLIFLALTLTFRPGLAEDRDIAAGSGSLRFASLRTSDANLRRGPGRRYRIDWIYHRRLLPVEILRDFDVWRYVRTADGMMGWMHVSQLSAHRTFFVEVPRAVLREAPQMRAKPLAYLKRGVVGHLQQCQASSAWCRVRVGFRSGYLARAQIWGTYTHESVND
jgi:SH3-like domain-containing protein